MMKLWKEFVGKQGYQWSIVIAVNEVIQRYARSLLSLSLSSFSQAKQVIVSQAVMCAKPDKEIYMVLIDRVKKHFESKGIGPIEADEVFFIDDKQANVDAARAVGLRAEKFDARKDTPERLKELLRANGVNI